MQEVDVYLPDNVDLRGECDEDYANLGMTFKGFELIIYFRKVFHELIPQMSKGISLISTFCHITDARRGTVVRVEH